MKPPRGRLLQDDGWLHTGDLGTHGCRTDSVTITGRRKEILVLSNGKNIACAPLEHALERSPYIQQALIVGDGRKYRERHDRGASRECHAGRRRARAEL